MMILEKLCLKCINCKKETGFSAETGFEEFYDEFITQLVLNAMLHYVGMSWIISSKKEINYDDFTNRKSYNGLIQVHGTTKIFVLNYMELLLKILLHRLEQTNKI